MVLQPTEMGRVFPEQLGLPNDPMLEVMAKNNEALDQAILRSLAAYQSRKQSEVSSPDQNLAAPVNTETLL